MANNALLPDPRRIPYIVSVSGHIDLRSSDIGDLQRAVHKLLQEMRSRMSHTQLILLTGLAGGADQLVAKAALEEGAQLVAALPLPTDIYRAIMTDDAHRAGFDDLLGKCIFTIPLQHDGYSEEVLRESEDARAHCYRTLARFLVSNSQALIALWDGVEIEKSGGTSCVVRYMLEGIPSLLDTESQSERQEEPQVGTVYQIVTPRLKNDALPHSAFKLRTFVSELDIETGEIKRKAIHQLKGSRIAMLEKNIDLFNRDALKWPGPGNSYRLVSKDKIHELSSFLDRLRVLYHQADLLSIRANSERRIILRLLLACTLSATLAYAVYTDIFSKHITLWLMFPCFLALALCIHQTSCWRRVEDRYIDARSLAEALRVQFFWEMGGVEKSVADCFLLRNRSELDWIRSALRSTWLFRAKNDAPAEPDLKCVQKHWLLEQKIWYTNKASSQHALVERHEKFSGIALWMLGALFVFIPISLIIRPPWPWLALWQSYGKAEPWYGITHLALVIPALVAGGYKLWVEQSGYIEQNREYARLSRYFAWKHKLVQHSLTNPATVRDILFVIGKAALEENGLWLLHHRDRPLQVVGNA